MEKNLMDATVTARLTVQQRDELEKHATEKKITKSRLVRIFIEELLKKQS
jgi:hypothetical protein